MIPIFIPTFNRVGSQLTINHFPREEWGKSVWLVAPATEDHGDYPVIHYPHEEITTISKKRQWILEYALSKGHDWFITVDDDVRRAYDPKDYQSQLDFYSLMKDIAEHATENVGYITSGSRFRFFDYDAFDKNRGTGSGSFCLWNARAIHKHSIRFDEVPFLEDLHVSCSLLENGYDYWIFRHWIFENRLAASGGAQDEMKSRELRDKSLVRLNQLHPEIVRLIPKEGNVAGRLCSYTMACYPAVYIKRRSAINSVFE